MDKGKVIKQLRLKSGMTQDDLAALLGTTKQTIYKYETGIITNIPSDKIQKMADVFKVSPLTIMGISDFDVPAAYGIPILGTICAGDGIHAEQDNQGKFFVDSSIHADYCLRVHGDSMMDAHIYDGDIAFLEKDYEFEDGKIYGVVYGADDSATLKKVFRADGKFILQPCSPNYKAIIEDPDNVFIVGEMVGVYHSTK